MSQKVKYNGTLFERKHLAAAQMAKDMVEMKDPIMRRFAATTLSNLGFAEALKHYGDFLKATQDEDTGVRYWALVYLCGCRSFSGPSPVAEHTAELVPLLEDEDPGCRYFAIETLTAQGFASQAQVSDIMKRLDDPDPHCRIAAAKAIGVIDPERADEAAEKVLELIDPELENQEFFRASGIEGLALLGKDVGMKHIDQFMQALGDIHPSVRRAAAKSLQVLGQDAVLPAAAQLARLQENDTDKQVREEAAATLKKLDLPAVLRDECVELRRFASSYVAELKTAAAEHAEVLASLLRTDEDEAVRYFAAIALSEMGPAAEPFLHDLRAALEDSNPEVWPPAARGIMRNVSQAEKETAVSAAVEVLKPYLSSEKPLWRARAIEAISAARDEALPHLEGVIAAIGDEELIVRLAAMKALQNTGARGVRKGDKALAQVAKTDPDSEARREALNMLRHFMLAGKFGLDGLS
eukprot:TRINITY_DN107291_c0_g1_i1.p1 TRINITY_DN107291_c0_g1~~TRINITY_DN107291_c0_g1_i1.p1  ORF type:complete len:467 (-),score=123.88 TRINITY_DN107291_c0_g1_i1:26-1426(-)